MLVGVRDFFLIFGSMPGHLLGLPISFPGGVIFLHSGVVGPREAETKSDGCEAVARQLTASRRRGSQNSPWLLLTPVGE